MTIDNQQAQQMLDNSTLLYTQEQLDTCIKRLASEIEADFAKDNEIPLFLTVMNGGMFFSSQLLFKIKRPIISDYIHASRYGDATIGSSHITWYRQPRLEDVVGKTVYIIDDVLEEGYTLAEIKRLIIQFGAKQCKFVVLIDKNIGIPKPIRADFVGIADAPKQFLIGYGMDVLGVFRNLPDIYLYNG